MDADDTVVEELLLYTPAQLREMTLYTLRTDVVLTPEQTHKNTMELVLSFDVGVKNLGIAMYLLPTTRVRAFYDGVRSWNTLPARLVGVVYISCTGASIQSSHAAERRSVGERVDAHQAAFDMMAKALDRLDYIAYATYVCIEWQYSKNYLAREIASAIYGYLRRDAYRRERTFDPPASVMQIRSIDPRKKTKTLPIEGSFDYTLRKIESSVCMVGWLCETEHNDEWKKRLFVFANALYKCYDVFDAAMQAWVSMRGRIVKRVLRAEQRKALADKRAATRAMWWDAAKSSKLGARLIDKYNARLETVLSEATSQSSRARRRPKKRSRGTGKRRVETSEDMDEFPAYVYTSASSEPKTPKTRARHAPQRRATIETCGDDIDEIEILTSGVGR